MYSSRWTVGEEDRTAPSGWVICERTRRRMAGRTSVALLDASCPRRTLAALPARLTSKPCHTGRGTPVMAWHGTAALSVLKKGRPASRFVRWARGYRFAGADLGAIGEAVVTLFRSVKGTCRRGTPN